MNLKRRTCRFGLGKLAAALLAVHATAALTAENVADLVEYVLSL